MLTFTSDTDSNKNFMKNSRKYGVVFRSFHRPTTTFAARPLTNFGACTNVEGEHLFMFVLRVYILHLVNGRVVSIDVYLVKLKEVFLFCIKDD